ncbi:hypothetical protein ATN83_4748 [Raoultella ornithinolytica]|nr:hypothetical protein ATN83_4748 [Raoultella ornithinolytica]
MSPAIKPCWHHTFPFFFSAYSGNGNRQRNDFLVMLIT